MRILEKKNRYLLQELVITDFKLRYQGSVLGYLWSLVRPLAVFGVLFVVFNSFFRFGSSIPNYPTYLLLGLVLWNFFVEATTAGMGSIVGRGDLIRKVNLPKYIIVLSTTFSALINLAINLCIVAAFMVISGVEVSSSLLLLPIYIIELFVLALALGFLLSALYVRYRDIAYIWELVLQVMFYATPIIYPLTLIPDKYVPFLLSNPVAQVIQDARQVTITDQAITLFEVGSGILQLVPWAIVVFSVWVASNYFKRVSRNFAENI